MHIRIDPKLREALLAACKSKSVQAAQVIRNFIKTYITIFSANAMRNGIRFKKPTAKFISRHQEAIVEWNQRPIQREKLRLKELPDD